MSIEIFTPNLFWPIGPFDLRFVVVALLTNIYVYYCKGLSSNFLIAMVATIVLGAMLAFSDKR